MKYLKKCDNKIAFNNLNKLHTNSDDDSQTCYEDSDVNDSTTCYEESEVEDGLEEEQLKRKLGYKKKQKRNGTRNELHCQMLYCLLIFEVGC